VPKIAMTGELGSLQLRHEVECSLVTSVRVMCTYPIDEGDGARYAVVAGPTDAYLETVFEHV
jgi:hypothetical protein